MTRPRRLMGTPVTPSEETATAYVSWYGKGRHQAWQTPSGFFADLHDEFRFDLDGAASDENALLPEASTLTSPVPWTGRRVFCNPPWSDIASFLEYAPSAELAVFLVPARTNARWFHRAMDLGAEIIAMFIQGWLRDAGLIEDTR
jgi:hypothetical protein